MPSDKARSDPKVILESQTFRILGFHYRTRDNNPECTKEECASSASLRFMCKKEVVKCKVKENSLSGHTKKIARSNFSRAGGFGINGYTIRKFSSWIRKKFSNMIKTSDQNGNAKASRSFKG